MELILKFNFSHSVCVYVLQLICCLIFQLVEKLHNVNFTLDDERKVFDKNGDFKDGYDVLMLMADGENRRGSVIGRYDLLQEKVLITDQDSVKPLRSTVSSKTIQQWKLSSVHICLFLCYNSVHYNSTGFSVLPILWSWFFQEGV